MKATFVSLILLAAITARAQSPPFVSTGAAGALELTTPGTVIFDPVSLNLQSNPPADNVFQFTTIHIGKGVTVKLLAKNLSGPAFWIAQGPVEIDGTVDLTGEDGGLWPSLAGAGGFPGGAPGKSGYGPVGFTLNAFLVPLEGGFGGKGGETVGGGAGGGALLIASRTSITVNGKIIANGGSSSGGFGGGGGAIRLVAPLIEGSGGTIGAAGGQPNGAEGAIRFESDENRFMGTVSAGQVSEGKPLGLFLPPNPPPSVRIVSIDGVLLSNQEFTTSQPSTTTVAVEGHNIPTGTVVELQCFSENGQNQTVKTSPLIGTAEHSSATAELSFQKGTSRCFAATEWTPPRLQ